VETLMRVQLGGGTDIGKALRYCSQLLENPQRTVLVLVSDFYEGASPNELLRTVKQLAEARVTLLGLAALDDQANPDYDRQMATRLAACGMQVAALSPRRLAHWLLKVIS
jgi:Mg-chelatase subunit ChlD